MPPTGNGLCKINPAGKSIRLPKIEPSEKHTYTQRQYVTACSFAKSHPDGLAIMLMMETGITHSELLGLRWSDIDTKNKYRRRVIPLVDPDLIQQLEARPRTIEVSTGRGMSPKKVKEPLI